MRIVECLLAVAGLFERERKKGWDFSEVKLLFGLRGSMTTGHTYANGDL